jgi:chemotaxis protein methyltransferase CheR
MATQLETLVPSTSPALSEAELLPFQRLVRDECGLVLPKVRRKDLERVVVRTLASTGLPTTADLHSHLKDRAGRRTLEKFLGALTVGETYFFRNRHQFDALQYHLLPELIDARRPDRRLRIWCAGCSTGEEPYSVAMLLRTLLPDIDAWNITILATDINPSALDRAERALYGPWSFREIPPLMKARFFAGIGDELGVTEEIRSMVSFRYLNLVSDAYPSLPTNTVGMDLVLCRNVLIYFDDVTTGKVVGKLHSALVQDGKLLVAPAEFSQDVFRSFQTLNFPGTVVYKRPRARPSEAAQAGSPGEIVSVTRYVVPNHPPATVIEHAAEAPPTEEDLGPPPEERGATNGDAGAAYQTAKNFAGRLELEQAADYASLAIERDPLLARAHHLLGLIYIEQNRPEDALRALRACVFADRSFALGHYTLADVLARMGQHARATKALDNTAALLSGMAPDAALEDGDGLTAGRLLEMVVVQRALMQGAR